MTRILTAIMAVALAMVLGVAPSRAQKAYVTNNTDGTVTVIATATDSAIGTINVLAGGAPIGVAVTPDGTKVYVVNQASASDGVSVIRTSDNTVIATLSVGLYPFGVAVTPDGSKAYVTNSGDATVSVIDTATNTVLTGSGYPISVGNVPQGVAVTPDGNFVYVANGADGTVSVINTASDTVVTGSGYPITVGGGPVGVAVTPDGSMVYVANSPVRAASSVSVIRTSDNTVPTTISGFFAPQGLAVTPNGSFVYVANFSTSTVSVIDTATNGVTPVSDPLSTFNEPEGVAVTPDGTKVYVANFADNALSTISVIDTATNTVTTTAPVGGGPEAFGNFIGPPILTVSETGNGQVTSSPVGINCSPTSTQCALGFAGGTHVTLTATANAGSMFSAWRGGGCVGTSPCVIDLTNDTAVSATFTLIPSSFPLTVTDAGSGSGTVTSNPSGISCGATCSANFASGTPVVLTATPAPGSMFSGWSGNGACSGTGTCTVTMSAAESVTATFTPIPPVTLTVAEAGTGAGLVTSSPLGINCSATSNQCAAPFAVGTPVTLTASASGQSTFAGWSGGGCAGTGSCVVTLGANTTVTATFNPPVTVTVAEAGTGTGQVTSSPMGINCSATSNQCAAQFAVGTPVTLTASASAGSSFSGWSGGVCSGTATCQLTLSADTTVTATFTKKPTTKALSVVLSGGGSGTVMSLPSGINCGPTCTASFDTGTQITLAAAATSGSTFAGWSGGGCSGANGCTLTLSADTTVTASFVVTSANLTLVAAVLPTSRSVEIGTPATAFATIINAGPADAGTCTIAPATSIPAGFVFQTTDPITNALTGTANTPANIAAGQAGTFVIALTPTAAFPPTNVAFTFTCANAPSPAASIVGVDTLNLSASATPVPDIVALAASADRGYVDIPGVTGTGVFAVATVNLGVGATITVTANTGMANLPVTLTLCQTADTGVICLAPPAATVTADIQPNAIPAFGVFVAGSGFVADMPAVNRVFVTFTDGNGVLRGETSVAVRTQ